MTHKQRLQDLKRRIQQSLPGASVGIDAPSRSGADWFVDVAFRGQSFVIEYRPKLGFGLSSTPSGGYGQGPDEFFPDAVRLVKRLARLARRKERTEPVRPRLLQELRSVRRVTQNAIADRLGIRQPTVSKIERRKDMNLSTLRRYVQALGGELQVTAKFNDGTVELGLGEDA